MSKRLSLAFLVLFLSMILMAPTPVRAVGPLSFLSNFTQTVQNRWQRFFLKLPGNKSGLVVLQQSFASMANVKSLRLKGEVAISAKQQDTEIGNFFATIAGPIMVEDIRAPYLGKQDLTIAGKVMMQGSSYPFGLQMKSDASVVYFKLTEVPGIPGLSTQGWVNQWFKVDQSKTQGTTAAQPANLSDEKIAQLQATFGQLLKDSQISQARRETVDGRGVFVVDVTISKGALVAYLKTVNEIVAPENSDETPTPWESLEKQSSPLKEVKITLTVDRDTLYLSKAVYDVVLDLSSTEALEREKSAVGDATSLNTSIMKQSSLGGLSASNVQMRITMGMSDFNQQFNFSAPAEAKDFQEMMVGAFGQMMGGGAGLPGSALNVPTDLPNGKDLDSITKPGSIPPVAPGKAPKLTPEQEKMLKQYGISPEDL